MDLREAVALSLIPLVRTSSLPGLSGRPGLRIRLAEAVRRLDTGDPPPPGMLLRELAKMGSESGQARRWVGDLEDAADRALRAAQAAGIEPMALDDPRYPPRLAAIPDPPLVLWAKPAADRLSAPSVAIVGSRAASPYALDMGAQLARDLAARGIVVVSGLARGVDSAAHRGALEGGDTLAVLGSGVDVIYPAEHAELAAAIERQGALLSELPPGTPPRAHHFPLRNRIISGLVLAVVVIEASEKSGSLITAGCALEQGREVMAVPGNALTGRNRGAHALLKDGAKIVETADDILEELSGVGRLTNSSGSSKRPIDDGLEADRDPILMGLASGDPCSADDLVAQTGLEAAQILAKLAEFELNGLVRRVDGGRFVRTANRAE